MEDDFSDLVGQELRLPETEFNPPTGHEIEGRVLKVLKATKRYPAGRLELSLLVDGRRQTFLWDQSLFKREWVVPPSAGASSTTPRRRAATAAAAAASGGTPRKTPPPQSCPPPPSRAALPHPCRPSTCAAPHSRAASPANGAAAPSHPTSAHASPATAPAAHTQVAPSTPAAHPPVSKLRGFANMVVLVVVALPALYFAHHLQHTCTQAERLRPFDMPGALRADWQRALLQLLEPSWWCALGQHPILAVNVVYFLNVNVLFWVLSLVQGSTWLIDPYWTIIPPMIGLFYKTHPASLFDPARSLVSMTLLFVWATRLTHSYFRREGWQLGAREDWRFTDMAAQIGRSWWWVSFFAAYLSQQVMLVGITLPLAAIHSSAASWDPVVDTLSAIAAAAGIALAFASDNQLRAFMLANEGRAAHGQKPVLVLDTGLFRYSRHPNYFGEQLWWWGLSGFALSVGQPWMMVGALLNSLSLVVVTYMVEARMMRRPERRAQFRAYQATTSPLVPWFKRTPKAVSKQE
ncbi:MAG: hypothetical protein WDW38_001871 [Sanguina aurantia]